MSEKVLLEHDEIGPEVIIYAYDPQTGMKGVVAMDSSIAGCPTGGTRMAPDVTVEEVVGLARAMTYKNAMLGFPVGGAKGGIIGDAEMPRQKKIEVLRAFGRALKPHLQAKELVLGTDMGITHDESPFIWEGAGMPTMERGGSELYAKEIDGDRFATHTTGYGVVVAMKCACELTGLPVAGAKVAIEGFGAVGGGVLRYASREGAKVVAISTIHEAIYNESGLDAQKLLELRKKYGDKCLAEYHDAKHIRSKELYFLPVDILVPGARPYVLDKRNAGKVKAKLILEAANIPITDEAEDILYRKGIISVPDFVANCGGVVVYPVSKLGGTVEQAFRAMDNAISKMTKEVITEARQRNMNPRAYAIAKCKERLSKMRGQPKKTYDEALPEIRKLLGV